jgi:hypothetical protein
MDKAERLDLLVEAGQCKVQLAGLLLEGGQAVKRADGLLREALAIFWAHIKEPHPCIMR